MEEKDPDVYSKGREDLEENDEIDEAEEGFMQGYEQDKDPASCAFCKTLLTGTDFHEEELEGENLRFCSKDCADKYKEKN